MSRYTVTVKTDGETDENAVIGYDPPLRTFFLQAFPDEETDEYALWFGTLLEQHPSLESIIESARRFGYEIEGLSQNAIIAMTKEAGTPTPPSLGERLGLVRCQWSDALLRGWFGSTGPLTVLAVANLAASSWLRFARREPMPLPSAPLPPDCYRRRRGKDLDVKRLTRFWWC